MVYTFLPFAILPIYAAAEKFDFRLLEAARDLGAGPLRAFALVFLPGIRSGLLTAFLVVFIPALGSYVIPDLVGGPGGEMLGNKIAQRVFVDRNLPHVERPLRPADRGRAPADGRGAGAAVAGAPCGSDPRGGRVRRSRFPLAITWLLLAFFYLPIAVVVVSSFNGARFGGAFEGPTLDWYRRLFEHREIWPAVVNSLVIAAGATAASVVLGTTAAIALHRYHGRLQRLHYGLIYTPLVVPEILMGISLLVFFAAIGPGARPVLDLPRARHLLPELRRHGRAGAAAGLRRLGGGGRARPGRLAGGRSPGASCCRSSPPASWPAASSPSPSPSTTSSSRSSSPAPAARRCPSASTA